MERAPEALPRAYTAPKAHLHQCRSGRCFANDTDVIHAVNVRAYPQGAYVVHMQKLQHIYLTAHGTFTAGSWVGENAQFGMRLTIAETGAMPDKGAIFDIPENGDVVVDQGTATGTHGTLTRTWTARRGGIISDENADAGFQIDLAEDVWKFLDAVKAFTYSNFKWTHVKIAPVDAAGKTVGTAAVYTFTTALAGTSGALLPPQVAMAITVRANILGRRGRGRIYLPALGTNILDNLGVIPAAAQTTIRGAFTTLINDLQNLPGTPDYLPLFTVMSPGLTSGVRPSQVRTGQRLDTIRSRREQVAEVYTTTDL